MTNLLWPTISMAVMAASVGYSSNSKCKKQKVINNYNILWHSTSMINAIYHGNRHFYSSKNLIYSWHFFSSEISMNNSAEAMLCRAVNNNFTCSWLNFPSYWRGISADNLKKNYLYLYLECILAFLWNKYGQWSGNSQAYIQKIEPTSVGPDSPEARNCPPVWFLHIRCIQLAFLRTPLGVRGSYLLK